MNIRKKVLVCPLDWGLGHATRCIPVIHALLGEGAEVVIAADGGPMALLKEEFPTITFVNFPGYHIHYSKHLPMTISMLWQAPKILYGIYREHHELSKIISGFKIDCIISDNRYGLWNKRIPGVFISHQVSVKCPPLLRFLEPLLYRVNLYFIKKYNACWIPDVEGENNLSGTLSHKTSLPRHVSFIGPLSRFDKAKDQATQMKYKLMAIISGPEPHRTMLLEQMTEQLKLSDVSSIIVAGEPEKEYDTMLNDKVRLVSHLNSIKMQEAILLSEIIICRAGYSGIMDLAILNKNAILIPTPGQTEQEYLADYLHDKKIFYSARQKDFNLRDALEQAHHFGDFSKVSPDKKYLTVIKELMQQLKSAG